MSSRAIRRKKVLHCNSETEERGKAKSRVRSYLDIVHVFKQHFRSSIADELTFPLEDSFDSVLKRIALCQTRDGKRMPHQYRLKSKDLREAHRRLRGVRFSTCTSFDELFRQVDEAIGNISGIGPLTVYDIAHRLGLRLNLEPERIFLHAGTRIGAKAMGLGVGRDTLEVGELPEEFQELSASEIEDCLCIFKDEIRRITAKNQKG